MPIPRQEKQRKCHATRLFVVHNKSIPIHVPKEKLLKPRGDGTRKGRTEQSGYQFKKYNPACKECPVNHLCTSRPAGREIDRSQYAQGVEENNKRYQENPQLYRTRQEINEHYRDYKRQWGYNHHTNLTGLENGEHSLIMLVYNIKRSINILACLI
jgi:hypothetical protein